MNRRRPRNIRLCDNCGANFRIKRGEEELDAFRRHTKSTVCRVRGLERLLKARDLVSVRSATMGTTHRDSTIRNAMMLGCLETHRTRWYGGRDETPQEEPWAHHKVPVITAWLRPFFYEYGWYDRALEMVFQDEVLWKQLRFVDRAGGEVKVALVDLLGDPEEERRLHREKLAASARAL